MGSQIALGSAGGGVGGGESSTDDPWKPHAKLLISGAEMDRVKLSRDREQSNKQTLGRSRRRPTMGVGARRGRVATVATVGGVSADKPPVSDEVSALYLEEDSQLRHTRLCEPNGLPGN